MPKRVEWDQQGLDNAAAVLAERFDANPKDYIKVKLSVSEAVYQVAPATIRELFDPARTVKTGKPNIGITMLSAK